MSDFPIVNLSRRDVFKGGMALTLGLYLPGGTASAADAAAGADFAPNAFVRIGADGAVTVISKHLEMGQGTYTGLATLVAEELDADWSQVRVEGAPANTRLYANTALGVQGTGGSTATYNSYEQYRRAGATARAMLVTAASQRWNVSVTDIRVSAVSCSADGREAKFGELVTAAAALPVPDKVALKDPARFELIGKPAARVDAASKSNGTARFTQDVQLPGMLTAAVLHPPRLARSCASVDDAKARHPGRRAGRPVRYPDAAAASPCWPGASGPPSQGRDALSVTWDESDAMAKDRPRLPRAIARWRMVRERSHE